MENAISTVNADGKLELLAQHFADLQSSGLSDEQIRAAGIHSEQSPTAIGKLLNWKPTDTQLGSCLVIPYYGPDGKPTGYNRIKPDRPRMKGGKVVRYESPKGVPYRAYLPPGTRTVLSDPAAPLVVTEGEKKH